MAGEHISGESSIGKAQLYETPAPSTQAEKKQDTAISQITKKPLSQMATEFKKVTQEFADISFSVKEAKEELSQIQEKTQNQFGKAVKLSKKDKTNITELQQKINEGQLSIKAKGMQQKALLEEMKTKDPEKYYEITISQKAKALKGKELAQELAGVREKLASPDLQKAFDKGLLAAFSENPEFLGTVEDALDDSAKEGFKANLDPELKNAFQEKIADIRSQADETERAELEGKLLESAPKNPSSVKELVTGAQSGISKTLQTHYENKISQLRSQIKDNDDLVKNLSNVGSKLTGENKTAFTDAFGAFIKKTIADEFKTQAKESVFRGNSLATKMLGAFCKIEGTDVLQSIFNTPEVKNAWKDLQNITDEIAKGLKKELNPSLIRDFNRIGTNPKSSKKDKALYDKLQPKLKAASKAYLEGVISACQNLPTDSSSEKVVDLFKELDLYSGRERRLSYTTFVLRALNPALVGPHAWGLSEGPDTKYTSTRTLLSKILMTVSGEAWKETPKEAELQPYADIWQEGDLPGLVEGTQDVFRK